MISSTGTSIPGRPATAGPHSGRHGANCGMVFISSGSPQGPPSPALSDRNDSCASKASASRATCIAASATRRDDRLLPAVSMPQLNW
ncbi:unannotated protein [freshwater metagenome]|uniref:Unannotated protein n=1 Tax=freshwater metagenome TaxID=449393 RepID=A0A6J6CZJ7_9ZZZZ